MRRSGQTPDDRPGANEARLRALLHAWPAVEPGVDFEAGVRRRIACMRTEPYVAPAALWRAWPRQAWAVAAAALLGLLLGLAAARIPSASPPRHRSGEVLLHSQTLAGSYATLAGGAR